MHNPEGMYFVSFAVIKWIDVFVRKRYFQIVADSLNYCQNEKGMVLNAYCLMPSHVHLVFYDKAKEPTKLLKEFKTFTSKEVQKAILENDKESRDWIEPFMLEEGKKASNVSKYQFWQHHNKPIELWSNEVIDQKIHYIHRNPVEAGFVDEPEKWLYSSASAYAGSDGPVKVTLVG